MQSKLLCFSLGSTLNSTLNSTCSSTFISLSLLGLECPESAGTLFQKWVKFSLKRDFNDDGEYLLSFWCQAKCRRAQAAIPAASANVQNALCLNQIHCRAQGQEFHSRRPAGSPHPGLKTEISPCSSGTDATLSLLPCIQQDHCTKTASETHQKGYSLKICILHLTTDF